VINYFAFDTRIYLHTVYEFHKSLGNMSSEKRKLFLLVRQVYMDFCTAHQSVRWRWIVLHFFYIDCVTFHNSNEAHG
jgi:hypothetical protein